MSTNVLSKPIEVQGRLQGFGLAESVLRDAVEAGERVWRRCTENHPRTTPGYLRWSEMVKVLRDCLMPLGWAKREDGGVPTIVHPKGLIAIAVITGDQGTGNESSELRSKNPKGSTAAALVEQNAVQLEFDQSVFGLNTAITKPGTPMTWYLVVRRIGSELRFELSLPQGIGNDGHIDNWQERLLFTPINLEPTPELVVPHVENGDDIIVEVTRKF